MHNREILYTFALSLLLQRLWQRYENDMVTRKLKVTRGTKKHIVGELGCSGEAVRLALLLDRDTPLARAIRRDALALGAEVYIEAPIQDVLTIEGDCLVWDRGNSKATIDLEHKVIIIKDGEEQEKKIVLTITNLRSLIKGVKK